jgi:hypothetical protein
MSEPRLPPADVSQKEKQMNTTYKFAPVPSNSTVAGLVTMMVSAWFLMAAAAIFADPAVSRVERESFGRQAVTAPTEVAVAPEARFKVTVEAPRLKS